MGTKPSKPGPSAPKTAAAAPSAPKASPLARIKSVGKKDNSRKARRLRKSFSIDRLYTSTFEDLAPSTVEKSSEIWTLSPSTELFFRFSDDTTDARVDVFVSHVWADTAYLQSKGAARGQTFYFELKSTGLLKATEQLEARARVAGDTDGLRALATRPKEQWRFWMDHTCVNQESLDHKIHTVSAFRSIIERSNGLAVLLSPTYFSRLWCLFEVTCFLALKDLAEVAAYTWAFMDGGPELIQSYVASLRGLSVDGSDCLVPGDREQLRTQVTRFFHSEAAFEEFAKLAGTALVLQSLLLSPAVYSEDRYAFFIAPFLSLAGDDLALPALRDAVESFPAVREYNDLVKGGAQQNPAETPEYSRRVVAHVHAHVTPIVRAAAAKALRVGGAVTAA